jgi:threonine aldolase
MNFASDNWAGAHPAINAYLADHAGGFDAAYGAGELDRIAVECFREIFDRNVAVFFVATGTAANALALATVNRPGGVVFCHEQAHMMMDECGASEYLTGGARLQGLKGHEGKITPQELDRAISRFSLDFIHAGQPMAVSITQASEAGTLYTVEEISAIAEIAHAHGLPLHMDGARFANALVALETTPVKMAAETGVDIISFGATKNGCWCAEALVFLNTGLAVQFEYLRKRAAHLHSKSRFVASQFLAYFKNDLWLDNARHANAMASRLAGHIAASSKLRLVRQPQANMIFSIVERSQMEALRSKGAIFYDGESPRDANNKIEEHEVTMRLVTSFATTQAEIDDFGALII